MKRSRDYVDIDTNKLPKKRKFKYMYTPGMTEIPLHYLEDRMATDDQISNLERQLGLKTIIYTHISELLDVLSDTERPAAISGIDRIIFDLADHGFSNYEIYEEVLMFLDEIMY